MSARPFLRLFAAAVVLTLHSSALGTAQIPDAIIVNGTVEALHTNPLEAWLLEYRAGLPLALPSMTCNWRGYVATWELSHDILLLRHVRVWREGEWVDIAESLFGEVPPIPATWYSGMLIIPQGELVDYVHMGYASSYERYLIVRLEAGCIVEEFKFTHDEFLEYRQRRFAEFRRSVEYAQLAEQLTSDDPDQDVEDLDGFLFEYAVEQYLSGRYTLKE
jgi:hypothetical protein